MLLLSDYISNPKVRSSSLRGWFPQHSPAHSAPVLLSYFATADVRRSEGGQQRRQQQHKKSTRYQVHTSRSIAETKRQTEAQITRRRASLQAYTYIHTGYFTTQRTTAFAGLRRTK